MFSSLRNLKILIHILVWSLLFVLPHLLFDSRNVKPGFFPGSWFLVTNLYNVGLFYLNAFLLFPLFFNKRKWWLYILIIAALMIVSYYLKLVFTKIFYNEIILNNWAQRILFFPPIAFFVASIIYCLIVNKINYDKKQKEIVAEQLFIKLKFLRSQISPHFIFNVLTNLVSLARKKSERLEPALMMLSDLMRYMLYESDEKKVLLAKEIEYLESYIELQKLRFEHSITIKTNIAVADKELQHLIEPMLLIPFTENAFKHGLNADEPLIEINLSVDNGRLEFNVRNKFSEGEEESKDESSGIGLENVRSRLMLLYPKTHHLAIKKENNFFHVHLTLQLK